MHFFLEKKYYINYAANSFAGFDMKISVFILRELGKNIIWPIRSCFSHFMTELTQEYCLKHSRV